MPARLSTHYLPDEGSRFAPGDRVHVDQVSGRVWIRNDPGGEYVITGCRPATEFREGTPLLRVDLRWAEP